MEHPYHGIVQVGEVPIVVRRDSPREVDFTNTLRAGRVQAFNETAEFVQQLLREAQPYDDTRTMAQMLQFLGDRIRETQG